jgi:phosphoglucosamine mutase
LEEKRVASADRFRHGSAGVVLREMADPLSAAPVLFGTDGVRGIAGKPPLEKSLVRQLGAAAARVLREQVTGRSPILLLGRDTRGSGPWIAKAFAEGAASEQVLLRDAGVISTPSLAHLVPRRKALGGVMISASHNPAEFNGIKLFGPGGLKCPDAWERMIEKHVAESAPPRAARVKLQKDAAARKDYLAFLLSTLPKKTSFKGLTLVVDCGNGSLSAIAPPLLRKLGIRVIPLGTRPSGKNINAGAGSQHPEKMQRRVVERKADGGVAFDGDGDRAIFCDEHGRLMDGDYVIACAARCLKDENRLSRNTVVVTVMANLGLIKTLQTWGIETAMTAVGDRYVSDALDERKAVLGGEQSGHIIFREFLPTGDGLLTALQVIAMLYTRRRAFSWLGSLFQRYPQLLVNVDVKHRRPLEDCPDIQRDIQKARAELGDQGRVVVRYSGTEPLLRIMMEGPDSTRLKTLAEAIVNSARKVLGSV